MRYRIELTETAKAEIREQARWLRDQASPAKDEVWLAGLCKALATLGTRPLRCLLAAESDKFPEELRELLYGGKRNKHRIIFKIANNIVYVLSIRHSARDELSP